MKANCGVRIDRISNLPSNVIDGILQHLPIRDVVRTSILSRKWRYMWVSVPQLEFGIDFFEICNDRGIKDLGISSIITEILLLHNGPVTKFTLEIPDYYYPSEIACLSKWILLLSKSNIKYLELLNYESRYELPSHLFSCQGLTYLKLEQFELSVPPNFCGFKSLLELHLIDIKFESSALGRLFSGCPILNVLTIDLCTGFDCIHVSVPSLKVLCIGDQDIKSIYLKKAKSLTDLTLIMEHHQVNFEQVLDFIKGLPNMERLCLRGAYYVKTLSTGIFMQTLQNSINLKYLEFDGVDFSPSKECFSLDYLLSLRVELVIKEPELVIKSSSMAEAPLPDHLMALCCNSCCLSKLQKVHIKVGSAYEHAMDLIRILLAKSSSLEILTFKVGLCLKQSDTPTLFSISQDLLQMERASQRAEVKFLHDGLTEH